MTRSSSKFQMNIGIIGVGAVGSALARSLSRAGFQLTALIDRSAETARNLAEETAALRYGSDISLIQNDTKVLIMAVPDSRIESADADLSKILPGKKLACCVHTSGAASGSVLKHAASFGIPVGSMHPLQTFPTSGVSPSLKGVYFVVEGDETARKMLEELINKIGGFPLEIASDKKALYHAAAVFASNFFPVLLRESRELLAATGISLEKSLQMLKPIMRQSLENCLAHGEAAALTGPIARGDVLTVQQHLSALDRIYPVTSAIYRILSLKILELAMEKGLDPQRAADLQRALTADLAENSIPEE